MKKREKEAKLKDLRMQYLNLMDEILKNASKKSSTYPKINNKRAFRAVMLFFKMRNLLPEIKKLSNEAVLKDGFESGGKSGIVGNNSEEITSMRGHYFDPLLQNAKCMHVQPDGTLKEIKITDLKG